MLLKTRKIPVENENSSTGILLFSIETLTEPENPAA